MGLRHIRLLQFAEPAEATDERLAAPGGALVKPDELGWWDWTVFLLHTAAEIEHALMVQYLFAAYSLNTDAPGPGAPADAQQRVKRWRRTILQVAREEMGHLATVQNILRFVGGPLNFEREDFPFRSALYPFHFSLEPVTKNTLAKYVLAEMPAQPAQPDEVIAEIKQRAAQATGGSPINRVGSLYEALEGIIADPARLTDADLNAASVPFQAAKADWRGSSVMLIQEIDSRATASQVLGQIDAQGEGWSRAGAGAPSHFDRFLQIYGEFPESSGAWAPTFKITANPTTELPGGPSAITHPDTRRWALLFDLRYRMLLVYLLHALQRDEPMQSAGGALTHRGHLRDWVFLMMMGRGTAGMTGLAARLTSLPRTSAGSDDVAAPPFELPYTLALPDREHDRWRLHRSLLDSSRALIDELRAGPQSDPDVLDELTAIDADARAVVDAALQARLS